MVLQGGSNGTEEEEEQVGRQIEGKEEGDENDLDANESDEGEEETKRGWKHSRNSASGDNSVMNSEHNNGQQHRPLLFPGYGFYRNTDGLVRQRQRQQKQQHQDDDTCAGSSSFKSTTFNKQENVEITMDRQLETGLALELMHGSDVVLKQQQHHQRQHKHDRCKQSTLFITHDDDNDDEKNNGEGSGNGVGGAGAPALCVQSSSWTTTTTTAAQTPVKMENTSESSSSVSNQIIKQPKTPSPNKMFLLNFYEPFETIIIEKARALVPKIIVKTLLHNRPGFKQQQLDTTKDMHAYYISWPDGGDYPDPPPKSKRLVIPGSNFKGKLIRFYTSYSGFKFIYNHIMKANRNSVNSWVKHTLFNLEIFVPAIGDTTYNSLIKRIIEIQSC